MWLTRDVDMSKRKNKILFVLGVLVVATLSWIYVLPLVDPCGGWIASSPQTGVTAFCGIHKNTAPGYTVFELSYTPSVTDGVIHISENLDAQASTLISAWHWRWMTLRRYSNVVPEDGTMSIDELKEQARDNAQAWAGFSASVVFDVQESAT